MFKSSDGLTIEQTYTLAKIDGQTARIEIRGEASVNGKVAGEQTGQLQLDLATGWVLDGRLQTELAWETPQGTVDVRLTEAHGGGEVTASRRRR